MQKVTLLLLASFLIVGLAACNLPMATPVPMTLPAAGPPGGSQNCGFQWATHNLPDLSRQVQAAMEKAGMKEITVNAEAYGEDCIDAQTNKPVSFAVLETDFKISVQVRDLKDTEALGKLLEKILIVLDEFPASSTPGPQPGYVGVRFTSGEQELNLWFLEKDAKAAREEGLHGSALLERLQKK